MEPTDKLEPPDLIRDLSLRRLFKNTSYLFSGSLLSTVIALLQGIVVTRTLGPSLYGAWGVVVGFGGVLRGFLGLPTGTVLTYHLVRMRQTPDRSKLDLLMATMVALELCLAFATFAAIALAAGFAARTTAEGQVPISIFIVYGATSLTGFPLRIWASFVRDAGHFRELGYLPMGVSALRFAAIGVVCWRGGLDLRALAWIYLATEAVNGGLCLRSVQRDFRERYQGNLLRLPYRHVLRRCGELREMWRFSLSMYVSTSVTSVLGNADVLILTLFRSNAELGYYRLAKALVGAVSQLGRSLSSLVYQDFNELLSGRRYGAVQSGARRLLSLWLPRVGLALLLPAALSSYLIRGLYGAAYAPAVPVFCTQLLTAWVLVALFWSGSLIIALGDHVWYVRVQVVLGLVSVGVMALGSWLGGAVGLSLAGALQWWAWYGLAARRGLQLLDRAEAAGSPTGEGGGPILAGGEPPLLPDE